MKKMFQVLVALMMLVFSTQAAFAMDKSTTVDGSDLNAVHRMATAVPLYTQVKGAPTLNEVSQTLYAASSVAHNFAVLSYEMVAQNIMNDTHVNIKTLDRRQGDPQTGVVGDLAALHRDVEVHADQRGLAGEILGVVEGAEGHWSAPVRS